MKVWRLTYAGMEVCRVAGMQVRKDLTAIKDKALRARRESDDAVGHDSLVLNCFLSHGMFEFDLDHGYSSKQTVE